jgi:chromosome partitioning protein
MTYLGTALKPVMDRYDFLLFDTSPSVGFLQGAALWVSDYLIIPSAVDFLSLEGVSKVTDTLTEIRASIGWTGKLAGIQPTFYDATKESKTILADMGEKFGKETILAPIHRAVVLRECAAYGQTIFELDQNSRAAAEYSGLVNHVLKVAR